MSHSTAPRNPHSVTTEAQMWQALEMDEFEEEMAGSSLGATPVGLGTGHTHNACYQCSNSLTTAGCGTCG
jgi:hypothetical protein